MGKFRGVLITFGLIAASLVAVSSPATGASVVCSTAELPFLDVDLAVHLRGPGSGTSV